MRQFHWKAEERERKSPSLRSRQWYWASRLGSSQDSNSVKKFFSLGSSSFGDVPYRRKDIKSQIVRFGAGYTLSEMGRWMTGLA